MSVTIKIRDKEFYSFEEFASNIYRFQEESFVLINSKKFLTLLKSEKPELFKQVINLRETETNDFCFTFKVSYLFNPLMPLQFYNCCFSDIKELGRKILNGAPKIDVYTMDFFKNSLMSYYLRLKGYDCTDPVLYSKIVQLEHNFLENEQRSYFKFGFLLAQTQKIVYRRRGYKNISAFFDYILKSNKLHEFAMDFDKNQYVFAWLELLGKENAIKKFESLVQTIRLWEE